MPGLFPGSLDDAEFSVIFFHGKVSRYSQKFPPETSQSAASSTVRALAPSDAKLLVSPKNLGRCAGEGLASRSLAVEGPSPGNGGISVTYTSSYGFTAGSYRYTSQDVREASIQGAIGGPLSASRLMPSSCG